MVAMTDRGSVKFKPIPLSKITERIETDAIGKHDLRVTGRDLEFTKNATFKVLGTGEIRAPEYKVSDWAFGQLCTKLGVPSNYLRKCPVDGPGGQKAQIDLWREKVADKTFMLRAKQINGAVTPKGVPVRGIVRAVVGGTFAALDNGPLWNYLKPFIEKNGLLVQSANVTDNSFHVRALYPEEFNVPTATDKLGVHYVGLHTANSETGARYLTGDFMMWRQICTNGMIAHFKNQSLFRQKHQAVEPPALRMQIASGLEGVQHHKIEILENMLEAKKVPLAKPLNTLEKILKDNKQTQDFIEIAKAQYEREPLATRFGVVQALTAAAKSLNVDKRMEVEALAGKFLLAGSKSSTAEA